MDKYNITYKTADGTVHAAIEFEKLILMLS